MASNKKAHPLQADIDALLRAEHGDPFRFLGMHTTADGKICVRALQLSAEKVEVLESETGKVLTELKQIDPRGVFEGNIPRRKEPFAYRLLVTWNGFTSELEDPYNFPMFMGETDAWLFGEGNHLRPYEFLGAHEHTINGVNGVVFSVWAPAARRVSVVGEFNFWDGRVNPMRKRQEIGVWELFLPNLKAGVKYKFEVLGEDGHLLPQKSDPYCFQSELRPATASIVHPLPELLPQLSESRVAANSFASPISIYEVHLGSWKRKGAHGDEWLSYRELADELVTYVKDMGFTHMELMPVSEFPFDGSWGYQPVGLFAPTSRFGPPEDFRYFVDKAHEAGIGIILDWVPGHFPTDGHGLGFFDGTHLYEHADPRQGFHQDWNTLIFNYGRNEVKNYLVGNALFWLERYGVDGLRVDAVASMLYNDYSRNDGEWVPNKYGGRENLDAVDFIRQLNRIVGTERPGAIMIAEESTAWPAVSRPPEVGGLGFHYKWNMGWMHDTLEYIKHESIHRKYHHNMLTFGLVYAFDENFILPLSHDEVVHGKGSILARMPGDPWQKFANIRAYYAFMYGHPGKKLLFMGDEFAQGREWDADSSLDWHLLGIDWHQGVQRLVRDLNNLYRELPALHQQDVSGAGFEWIDYGDYENSIISFIRKAADGSHVVVVCNFTPVIRDHYRIGVPTQGWYRERLNTNSEYYQGSNVGNPPAVQTENIPSHGREQSLSIMLPPLGVVFFEYTGQ